MPTTEKKRSVHIDPDDEDYIDIMPSPALGASAFSNDR